MLTKSKTKNFYKENVFLDFLKGLIVALIISFAMIILFAFSIKWFDIKDNYIVYFTMLIKGFSVFCGSLLAIKGENKGLVKGISFGIIYTLIAFIVFSMLAGVFNFNISSLLDLLISAIIGGIVGIVKVNKN